MASRESPVGPSFSESAVLGYRHPVPLGISADCDMHWQTAQSLAHCGGVPAAEWLAHTCLSVVIVLVCELKGKAIFRLTISHRL